MTITRAHTSPSALRLSLLFFSLFFSIAADSSCFSAAQQEVSKTYPISNFSAVDISGNAQVYLKQGEQESLTIKGIEQVISDVEVAVSHRKLGIDQQDCSEQYHIYLTVREINSLSFSGKTIVQGETSLDATEVFINTSGASQLALKINSELVTINSSGASNLVLQIESRAVNIHSSGSTEIMLTGTAKSTSVNSSGSTELDASQFAVNEYNVSTSGSSQLIISAQDVLSVNASGISSIKYNGKPKITQSTSGLASVKAYNPQYKFD